MFWLLAVKLLLLLLQATRLFQNLAARSRGPPAALGAGRRRIAGFGAPGAAGGIRFTNIVNLGQEWRRNGMYVPEVNDNNEIV